jgi:glutamine---fructose-6-phosphate transaminase (isomerizing)
LDGLRRLEYRGYDSAGIAVLNGDNRLSVRRASVEADEVIVDEWSAIRTLSLSGD